MAKPGVLKYLEKGKLIDSQIGFVDTFNWMVNYINNLRGDNNNIEVSNPTGSNPVVRLKDSALKDAGAIDMTVIDVETGSPTTVGDISSLTIESASDSAVTLALTETSDGATLTIGVHYVD